MPETYLVSAVGCKVNQYEAQHLRETLESAGLRPVQPGQIPDLAVVNTCAITRTAAKKCRQLIRRISHGEHTRVIVVGCGAADEPQRYLEIDGVIAVIGHDDDIAARLVELLDPARNQRPHNNLSTVRPRPASEAVGPSSGRCGGPVATPTPAGPVGASDSSGSIRTKARESGQVKWDLSNTVHRLIGHQRAFLKVQDGCDAACTYCIIPTLRKRLRSKPVDVAVREAADLVRAGHREIVVTGIFLGAYGRPTAGRTRHDHETDPLAGLVDALAKVPGLLRLRLSSLEPGDVTDELLDVVTRHDACVPHLHLPLQAGSDDVLRRMNRQYRVDDYLATIDRVNAALDRPAVTTDIIVGFPKESDEAFGQTLGLVSRVGFARVHAFPFSLRPGTAAERWQGELLPDAVVRDRMRRLRALSDETALAFRRRFMGKSERVIVETRTADTWRGRTDRYFPVTFTAPPEPDLLGQALRVTIRAVGEQAVTAALEHVD